MVEIEIIALLKFFVASSLASVVLGILLGVGLLYYSKKVSQ